MEARQIAFLVAGLAIAACNGICDTLTIDFTGSSYIGIFPGTGGIFPIDDDVKSSPVSGAITINTVLFSPDGLLTEATSGYMGGRNSSSVTVSDPGGSETFTADYSRIKVCIACTIQWWDLTLYEASTNSDLFFQAYSPNIAIDASNPLTFALTSNLPTRQDYFDATVFGPTSTLEFSWEPLAETPEPSSAATLIFIGCVAVVIFLRRRVTRN